MLELRRTLLVVVACSTLAFGCVAFDSPESLSPDDPDDVSDVNDPTTEIEDPCLCDSDACFEAWVRDSGHCGECVVFSCDFGEVHACAQCPGDLDPGPRPKGPQQDLQGGMGVDTARPL